MTNPIATYSFLPWLRQGIANKITATDGDPAVKLRATVAVTLALAGEKAGAATLTQPIARDVQLYGPGDIVGIERRAIVRTEPHNWITNFEPNYLAAIEFYDEDFPWRYTPAAPDSARHRLRPWIALVVLKEGEFEEGRNIKDRPLPYVKVADPSLFPAADQLWAWAHVHANRDLTAGGSEIISNDMGAVLPRVAAMLGENPDLAYSRILCPRKLDANAAYHAFLMPVFESGRLAGLGLNPDDTPNATHTAWAPYPAGTGAEPEHFPFYHRWFFHTGAIGDFEYLVRLLTPKPADPRVGRRDMDVQAPGSNLPGIADPQLGGVMKLGGALRVPFEAMKPDDRAEAEKFEHWAQPYPRPFQASLAALVNLADDYAADAAGDANAGSGLGDDVEGDPDPLITPPLYGRWHALQQRLLKDRGGAGLPQNQNWVHELNLDPRFRVAAGFGTGVVQEHQEEYLDAAWSQVGDVLEANRRIRAGQMAKAVSYTWHDRYLLPMQASYQEKALAITAPVHKRVLLGGFTLSHQMSLSVVPPTYTSAAMRRAVRPRGRLIRSLPFGGAVQPGSLLERVNAGEVTAAPPKVVPPGVPKVNEVAAGMKGQGAPAWLLEVLRRYPWLLYLPLALAAVILLICGLVGGGAVAVGVVVAGALVALYGRMRQWLMADRQSDRMKEENQTPESVDQLPRSPDFVIVAPGAGVTPPRRGATDSAEAVRFKAGLKDWAVLLQASTAAGVMPPRIKLDLPMVAEQAVSTVNPTVTIPRWIMSTIFLPDRIRLGMVEFFQEAMAYPEIDQPMYKPLSGISAELFLPNINLIAQNSITLLETNQKFVEAYMVGLNHEFARELLWREYPTDQRGSYFRQFWDVSGYLNTENLTAEQLKEQLRDIPPLHHWSRYSALGDHDNREQGGAKEQEVVLVIRGELLKKYPNAVIYAHKAAWPMKDGKIDKTRERQLVDLSPAEEAKPPRTKVKTPLYEAKVDPDIYFFGFDFTVTEAMGGTGEHESDPAGWFFVIKERPGEPRFGLDIEREGQLNVWNDLAWKDVLGGAPAASAQYIPLGAGAPTLTLKEPTAAADAEKQPQWEDDKALVWSQNANAADLAYMLFQAPVLVAVHAAEMLPK